MAVMKPGWARSTIRNRGLVEIPQKITSTWLRREMGMCKSQCRLMKMLFPKGVNFTAYHLGEAIRKLWTKEIRTLPEDSTLAAEFLFVYLLPKHWTSYGNNRPSRLRFWLNGALDTGIWGVRDGRFEDGNRRDVRNVDYQQQVAHLLLVCIYHKLL